MARRIVAPSLLSFVPTTTIALLLVLTVIKYDLVVDMITSSAEILGLEVRKFIIFSAAVVIALIPTAWLLTLGAVRLWNFWLQRGENIRILERERAALIDIYDSLNGREWKAEKKRGWSVLDQRPKGLDGAFINAPMKNEPPLYLWHGVKIDHTTRRVVKLILDDRGLKGTIPESISDLEELQEVDFRMNSIKGCIPASMASLTKMEGLYLSDNFLEGTIPDDLCRLPKLRGIYLYNNCFEDRERSLKLFEDTVPLGCYVYI